MHENQDIYLEVQLRKNSIRYEFLGWIYEALEMRFFFNFHTYHFSTDSVSSISSKSSNNTNRTTDNRVFE